MEAKSTEQTNDIEVIKKIEDEHLHLQRHVRMIQMDRINRVTGVHPIFRRQNDLLMKLKNDYTNITKDLRVATSGAQRKIDKKMKADLKRAILSRQKMEMDCEGGLLLMQQLDGLLRGNNKQAQELENKVKKCTGELEEKRSKSERRLMATENKMEAATLRFNAIQYENQKIREKIEHMLKDRAIFNQAWNKMLNALSKGKKFLTDLFESSTLAYDQRDEWCTKLKSIQEKGRMDQMLQIQEMRDLQKTFDHEMKTHNFLATKGIIRINKEQEEREESHKKKEEEEIKQQYSAHVKILENISDFTQESDIEKIIEEFQRTEQKNFAMYTMLSHYCTENVGLSRGVQKLRQELVDRKDWNEMMEEKRIDKLQKLNHEYQRKKMNVDKLRQKLEVQSTKLHEAMKNVNEMFKNLDCSLDPFENLLGEKQPSLYYLKLTFYLITEKIKEFIQTAYYYERHVQRRKGTSRLKTFNIHPQPPDYWSAVPITTLVPADPCPSCVEARWMSRVVDGPEVPLEDEAVLSAVRELATDPAFVRSDRIHPLADCRVPRSRMILARRYMQN